MIFWKRLVNSCFDIARFRTKYTFNITFRNMFITLPVLTKNMKYNYTVPYTLVQRLMWIWSIFKCFDEYPPWFHKVRWAFHEASCHWFSLTNCYKLLKSLRLIGWEKICRWKSLAQDDSWNGPHGARSWSVF